MAISLQVYGDAALSSVLAKLNVLQRSDGSSGQVDSVVYLGSTVAGKRFRAASNPGVDDIELSVLDTDAGAGQAASAVKLATSAVDLDSAVAGAPLVLGTQLLSGPDNSVEVHVRVEATSLVAGTYTDLSLATNDLEESYA